MNGKPSILIFIDWYLPGYKAGGPIQSCANLVEHLKGQADFYIITRNTDYCSEEAYTSVVSDEWNEVNGAQVYYFSKSKLSYQRLKMVINTISPDGIYINGIYSFYFSILPLLIAKQLKLSNVTVAARGMLASSAIQVKGIKKTAFFTCAKIINLYKGIKFQATNELEKSDILEVIGIEANVMVAPNLPGKQFASINARRPKNKGVLKLVSIARIAPEKNTKYALEVLGAYKGSGTIYFDIFGPLYDMDYWKECEDLIRKMPESVVVRYIGSIESRLVPETLENHHMLFMPSRGENFGHVILESLTAGCPVLISDQTPWKGLKALGIGFDHPLEEKKRFADTLQALVNLSQEEYNCLSDRAFKYAISYRNNPENIEASRALFNL
ncbi:glycosyltransferase [Pontibacter sp. MBLB2868]|uniref:glycosyltransferase n=1 Tax=Pontibacter sp. MBLB2868 TaxID=3451555 RepID=UPI003F754834